MLFKNPGLADGLSGTITTADSAYPWLLRNFAPTGIKGLACAALVAAIVSSLASILNSTAAIFTMDIYKKVINPGATEKRLVSVGRIVAIVALLIAIVSVKPLLGGLDQAFQYIQEYSGYIYPGVTVVFGMGLLWKKATNRAALWTTILTIPVGILIKIAWPDMGFVLRMGYAFIVLLLLATVLSLTDRSESTEDCHAGQAAGKNVMGSWLMFSLAAICFVAAMVFGRKLAIYHFDAIYMMGTLLAFLGLMLRTNALSRTRSRRAYVTEGDIFSFTPWLAIGASGIIVILAGLYIYFW